MKDFLFAFSTLFLTLVPVTNPFGMASIFIGYTQALDRKRRHIVALRVAFLSFLFLSAVFVIGPLVLLFFGVSINFIRISGGLLLAITSWQMITAKSAASGEDRDHILKHVRDVIFYPLTFPITVGAGSIAISVAIASDYMSEAHSIYSTVMSCLGGVAGIGGDMVLVAICYRFADTIFSKLGNMGTIVITRLSAFILVAIGLQVTWAGLSQILIEMFKSILHK